MNKQTAVKFLIEKIDFDANVRCFSKDEWKEIFEQAKQLERLQIEETYNQACLDAFRDDNKYGRDYYNETYGGQDE
jgi:hypothetical protein